MLPGEGDDFTWITYEKSIMKRTLQVLSTVTAILFGSASFLVQAATPTEAIQEKERAALTPSARMIEMGRAVAENGCASCHGMDGRSSGEDQPHLAGQRAVYLYRVLQATQNSELEIDSRQHISSFLSDEALLSVAAYYAGLIPIHDTATQDVTDEPEPLETDPFSGIRTGIKKCAKCHGETGNSKDSGKPSLTAQDPGYFITSMQAYVDGSRNHKLMKKLVGKLDEQTIKEMSVFYALQQPRRTQTQGAGDAKSGRLLSAECATCHGSDGNASGEDMPTLAGQDAHYFIKAMKAYQEGKRPHESMFEAVESLDEEELTDLATFYAMQEPLNRDVHMPLSTAEWVARCDRCHGIDGNSTDARFPMLAGQNEGYMRVVMQAYAAGNRPTSIMHKMSAPLSGTDIERIVTHYASQEPRSVVYIQLPCSETVE